MGILEKDGWDVFSSYSSLDNDLYRNWVKDFSNALKLRVYLELRDKEYLVNLDELAFFFDTESMPANGPLENELNEKVKASRFLFLFVGDNYLKSEWCGKELDWFGERFSGIQEAALKDIFLIVLTPGALRGVTTKSYLSTIKTRGIYQLAYPKSGDAPMPAQLRNNQNILGNNPDYDELVDKLATTLADRIIAAKKIPPPPPPPGDPIVTFGIVAPGLKDYRTQLAARVAQKFNIKVDCWEWDDLERGSQELAARLANARIFIQLIDKSPIGLAGGPQPGGIFALQKGLVPENVPLLWIEPADSKKPAQEEKNPVHTAFLKSILASALKLSADKSIEEFAEKLQFGDRPKYAEIMIEHSEEDQEEVLRVRKVIKDAWNDVAERSLPLHFSAAEWAEMRTAPDKLKSCHGIVVVDRSRPYKTLDAQLFGIEDELANRNQEDLAFRTFVLPPKSKPTILSWPYIRFQKASPEGPIEVFTPAALKTFLESVKARALSADAER